MKEEKKWIERKQGIVGGNKKFSWPYSVIKCETTTLKKKMNKGMKRKKDNRTKEKNEGSFMAYQPL